MAVTRLKRKAKRNKSRAAARQAKIKRLNTKPVIESVDVEAIKEEFDSSNKKSSKSSKKEEKAAAPKAEDKTDKKEEKKDAE